jgi:hypothetical protein
VLSAKFESSRAFAHALEVLPQLVFLSRGLDAKPPPSIMQTFVLGIHKSRASEGALKMIPLLGAEAAPLSPCQGGEY